MSADPRAVQCKACGMMIIFLSTERGKSMPVDASTVDLEDTAWNRTKHMPHWSTCSEAQRFRKERK